MIPVLKKSRTSSTISEFTTFQFDWKKLAEKPSGPGALSGWMEKRASLISREAWKKPVFLSPKDFYKLLAVPMMLFIPFYNGSSAVVNTLLYLKISDKRPMVRALKSQVFTYSRRDSGLPEWRRS